MREFLQALRQENRAGTATCYQLGLENLQRWLDLEGLDALKVTRQSLEQFQRWLSEEYRSPVGQRLGVATQGSRLAAVKTYYAWLHRGGGILVNPARSLVPPKAPRSKSVACDYLTQQEATALLQTQARRMAQQPRGSRRWAMQQRGLALLCLALATGRRRTSLLSLRVGDLDFARQEVRIEWEKGKPGRVLPCAAWAMKVAKDYVDQGRVVILGRRKDSGWLFVGNRLPCIGKSYLSMLLRELQPRTVAENPYLAELAGKKLRPHSLRVTFARLLFLNGANIRTVNELLLHVKLTTTARYTPLELEDVRRALRRAHPRD
jgi:site-specific recombinase XerD